MRMLILFAAILGAPAFATAMDANQLVKRLKAPPGFEITVFTDQAPSARAMALSDKGTVFCGSRGPGEVYAFKDEDGDGRAEKKWTVMRGLREPIGVAYLNGSLYASAISKVLVVHSIEGQLANPPKPQIHADLWPSDGWHGGRVIRFGPDGLLYVSVGSPCNTCLKPDYGTITRIENSKAVVVARGIRNSVGYDWHPKTGELWFTDNGRDMMGDNTPPCELNRLSQINQHFGFPFLHGKNVVDPEFGARAPKIKMEPPAWDFKAHNAPLGMRFYRGNQFPKKYQDSIYVALHGSWNRSKKDGYQVIRLQLQGNKVVSAEPFLTGFLDGEKTLGRPVDLQEMPDGSFLVSDDHAGCIYRVRYTGKR